MGYAIEKCAYLFFVDRVRISNPTPGPKRPLATGPGRTEIEAPANQDDVYITRP